MADNISLFYFVQGNAVELQTSAVKQMTEKLRYLKTRFQEMKIKGLYLQKLKARVLTRT